MRILSGMRGQVSGEINLETGTDHFDLNFHVGLSDFPGEHFFYDGKKVLVDVLTPGQRSPFGEFLYLRQKVITEGLLGGTLNRRWPLLDHERLKRIKYRGWKKKQNFHEIEYRPSKGGSLKIRIYLDEEWNHVKTVYALSVSAGLPTSPQRTYEKLTETFSELRSTSDFKIPTVWEMEYSYTGTNPTLLWKWTTRITDMETNLGSQNAPGSE